MSENSPKNLLDYLVEMVIDHRDNGQGRAEIRKRVGKGELTEAEAALVLLRARTKMLLDSTTNVEKLMEAL